MPLCSQTSPLVLVENGTTLVKACQTVLSLSDPLEFRPYLYNIPPKYIKFEDFFKKIGVEERPTIDHIALFFKKSILIALTKTAFKQISKKTVKRVVQQLF